MAKPAEEDFINPEELYIIGKRLGHGSHGEVYRAVRKEDGVAAAVKILPIQEEDEEETKQLLNEITILKDIHSPYLTEYYGSYIKGGNLWICMELLEGGSAHKVMKMIGSALEEEQLQCIIAQVVKGLVVMHKAKTLHRDVKADNILLNLEGEAKLADFGVSKTMMSTMGKKMTATGSPYWIAPEVMTSERYDDRVDVWSTAITAIELAEKVPPYYNYLPFRAMFLIGDASKPPPHLTNPEKWTENFNNFLKRCLKKDPSERPTCLELLEDPFIKQAKGPEVMKPVVERYIALKTEKQEEEAENLDRLASEHMKHKRNESSESDESYESGESGGPDLVGSPGSPKSNKVGRPRVLSTAVVALRTAVSSENSLRRQSLRSTDGDDEMWKISDLVSLMKDPERGVPIKDRTFRFKKIPNCFVANEAVDWMMQLKELNLANRDEAVFIGRELKRRGVIEHAGGKHAFADKKFLFQFTDGVTRLKQKTITLNMNKLWNESKRTAPQVMLDLLSTIHSVYKKYYVFGTNIDHHYLDQIAKEPQMAKFVEATGELQQVDLASLTQSERKAFWINAYNCLTLHTYATLDKFPTTVVGKLAVFTKTAYQIGEYGRFTLYDIEHTVLRGNMARPNLSRGDRFMTLKSSRKGEYGQLLNVEADHRLNFVLHSMCKSSAPLRLYHCENLDEELDDAMISFMKAEIESREVKKKKDIVLPKVFEWYCCDFVKGPKELPTWIAQTGARLMQNWNTSTSTITQIENPSYTIKYREWDWTYAYKDASTTPK